MTDRAGEGSRLWGLFSPQFLRFVLVGGAAALVNLTSRFLFQLACSYVPSVALGYTVGTVVSFLLNKYYTFHAHSESPVYQLSKFVAAAAVGVGIGTAVAWFVMLLYRSLLPALVAERHMETVAHLFAISVTTVYSFLAMKHFAFTVRKRSGAAT